MFFLFSKILFFLIQPLNWIVFLLVYGLAARNARRKRIALVLGVALLVFLTNPLALHVVSRAWEPDPMLFGEIEPAYDVAIVLGGFARAQMQPGDRLHFGTEPNRLTHALELYHRGKVKKLLITGGSAAIIGEKVKEGEKASRFLAAIGLPAEDVLVESESRNTHENALNTARLLNDRIPGARCLLLTSAFHMRRARGCFFKEGLEVSPFPTDHWSDEMTQFTPANLIVPDPGGILKWQMLIKEWVGCLVYWMRGYL